jgi:hypothetical protein
MGYLWGIFDHKPQHGTVAYLPCASGCRGSDSDPRHCRCVCRGLNHGILVYPRPVQPVPVPQGYNPYLAFQQEPEHIPQLEQQRALPEIKPRLQANPFDRKVGRASKSLGRKIGHSFKVSIAGYSQDDLNNSIVNGMRKQFSQERVDRILASAFQEYGFREPEANRPELYELYESGFLDRALEREGTSWVIGRPKIRR